jgi:hypothetical protein
VTECRSTLTNATQIEGDAELNAVSALGFSTVHSFERWTWPIASIP